MWPDHCTWHLFNILLIRSMIKICPNSIARCLFTVCSIICLNQNKTSNNFLSHCRKFDKSGHTDSKKYVFRCYQKFNEFSFESTIRSGDSTTTTATATTATVTKKEFFENLFQKRFLAKRNDVFLEIKERERERERERKKETHFKTNKNFEKPKKQTNF